MVNPLIHDWWQQHETLDDKAARAVDLVFMCGLSRLAAANEVGLNETTLRRRLRKWGIEDWVPKGYGASKPRIGEALGSKPRTWKALGQPPLFLWPFQKAKGMLWRGAAEEEAAAAVGAPLAALQEGLAVSMAWCLATGRCPWCEILLDHAEDREGEMCGVCARVLRGEPLLPGDYAPDVRRETMEYAVRLSDVMENDGRLSRVRLFRGDVVLLEGPDLDRASVVLLVGPEDRVKKVVQYLLTNKGRKGPARCYGREPGGVWRAIYAVD